MANLQMPPLLPPASLCILEPSQQHSYPSPLRQISAQSSLVDLIPDGQIHKK